MSCVGRRKNESLQRGGGVLRPAFRKIRFPLQAGRTARRQDALSPPRGPPVAKTASGSNVDKAHGRRPSVKTMIPRLRFTRCRPTPCRASRGMRRALQQGGWACYEFIGGGLRFMCSWMTTVEDIDALCDCLKQAARLC